jgi:DNA-binding CsgD family transcriptional regulator/N-acetylneuraminic acid mutarotase
MVMTGKSELSEREQEILRLVATGASNKEIAKKLFISTNTVRVHLRNIFSKINVESRTEAAMYAVKVGLVNSDVSGNNGKPSAESAQESSNVDSIEKTTKRRVSRLNIILVFIVVILISGIIYILNLSRTQTAALELNPTTQSRLSTLSSMPTPRAGLGVVVYGNQIYAIAGTTDRGITSITERYDPQQDSWEKLPSKKIPVTDIKAALLGDKIYVPGGRLDSGLPTDVMEIYDPVDNIWTMGPSLPIPISGYSLVPFEGKLYLFGGWDGSDYLQSVYAYNPQLNEWERKSDMDKPRAFANATVATGKIFIMGGYNGKQALNENVTYQPGLDDGQGQPWGIASPLPIASYGSGLTSIADVIYLIGGASAGNSIPIAYFYVPQLEEWQKVDLPISMGWSDLGLVTIGLKIYGVGGIIDKNPTGENLSYQAIYMTVFPVIP